MNGATTHNTISRRLLMPLMMVGAAAAVLAAWSTRINIRDYSQAQIAARARLIVSSISAAANASPDTGYPQRFVSSLAAERDVRMIVVVAGSPPRVRASTRREWLGRDPAKIDDAHVRAALSEEMRDGAADSEVLAGPDAIAVVQKVELAYSPSDVESADRGVVLVSLAKSGVDSIVARFSWLMIVQVSALMALTVIVAYRIVRRTIVAPVLAIARTVEARTDGDDKAIVPHLGDHELGRLGASINRMFVAAEDERRHRVEVEAAMRNVELRWQLALDATADGLWDENMATGRIFRSQRWHAMFGYEIGEIPETVEAWRELVHPEDRDRVVLAMAKAMSGTASHVEAEYRMRKKDGTYIWTMDRAVILRDASDQPVRLVGAQADIDERKNFERELRENERRFRSLTMALAPIIWETDPRGSVDAEMPAWQRFTGATFEQTRGFGWISYIHAEDRPTFLEKWNQCLSTGGLFEHEYRLRAHNGIYRRFSARGVPIKNEKNEIYRWIGSSTDVTERRRAEKELKEYAAKMGAAKESLEKQTTELERSMRELEVAKVQAEDATKAKSEFLANMSHELRTPMNGVIGMVDLLSMSELAAEQRDLVRTLKSSADTLLGILNDILDFSKIEAGKLSIEQTPFDLHETIEQTIELLAARAYQKGLEVIVDIDRKLPPTVIGDPIRVRQILSNLLGNAIKFTAHGHCAVALEVTDETETDIGVKLVVLDTGIGIPADKLGLMFQKFTQADTSTTRRFGGTGLGLAISRQLAVMMNGDAGVTSLVGEGSTFWATLRLKKADVPVPAAAEPRPSGRAIVVAPYAPAHAVLRSLFARRFAEVEVLASIEESASGTVIEGATIFVDDGIGAEALKRLSASVSPSGTNLVLMSVSGFIPETLAEVAGSFAAVKKPVRIAAIDRVISARSPLPAPIDVTPKAAPEPVHAEVTAPTCRVLLAEDNVVNQLVARKFLERFGCAVEIVDNGVGAVEKARSGTFDFVLMDCQMPEMDGFQATRAIRAEEKEPAHIPIIAMTANAMKDDRRRCLDAGMDDFISKPFRAEDLERVIDRFRTGSGR